jgi:dienelactone hydrolase
MFFEDVSSWNLRDRHMVETLNALVAHLSRQGAPAKIVVWAHNSHLGDARATDMGQRGELNVGQLVRDKCGRDVVLVGFTTHHGTVTAASDWGGAAERKRVRPGLPGSYEALFHSALAARFLLTWPRDDAGARHPLREPRLERAIGVIYRPETERMSHYFRAQLTEESMQADAEISLVHITAGPVTLEGNLSLPRGARGIVMFAHGSGSSRLSPRNRYVAQLLNQARLATLLVDLLTAQEEAIDLRTARLRFDIGLLAERLVGATDWLLEHPQTRELQIGYFGASTGAAAALVAAAERLDEVAAIVSRGGRPDLAGPRLPQVRAPTLLIVGGNDVQVIELNRAAFAQLRCEKQLVIVPGATHLFEEPGALDEVARLAREWFQRYLARAEASETRANR